MALEVLREFGYPTDGMRSKPWDEFATPEAPVMDFVFTVCDQAAGEACPVWPGQPMTAHWGIEDPSHEDRGDMWKRAAFTQAFRYMKNRISAFTALPVGAKTTAGDAPVSWISFCRLRRARRSAHRAKPGKGLCRAFCQLSRRSPLQA